MELENDLRSYFKKDVSYVIFNILLIIFAASVILRVFYGPLIGIIPYWVDLVPEVETYLGMISSFLILGILVTEYVLK
ncbi:hypothetical protein [Methanococcus maripaludis]|uniref:Uncharacterized protein n=1 Tax=Methanococcus maripaludis TaxID=39152 RepID=A0A7J9S1V8_METMI|nr:hypothetical protein [Methanococcus maripaludis]MBB6067934.1 hypothetical protein [Methanococcus maripaludis]MBM7408805.1 hypothetical protein [Methanococcus maripaludis]MBP2219026.1 hypothetical protein [Methanococcus maripaludis]